MNDAMALLKVYCAGGCGRLVEVGARDAMCDVCLDIHVPLEARRLRDDRDRRFQVGRFANPARLATEAETAARASSAGGAALRSKVLAMLPRKAAGLGEYPPAEVCEASDFPTMLAGSTAGAKLAMVSTLLLTAGLAAGMVYLMIAGAKAVLTPFFEGA